MRSDKTEQTPAIFDMIWKKKIRANLHSPAWISISVLTFIFRVTTSVWMSRNLMAMSLSMIGRNDIVMWTGFSHPPLPCGAHVHITWKESGTLGFSTFGVWWAKRQSVPNPSFFVHVLSHTTKDAHGCTNKLRIP